MPCPERSMTAVRGCSSIGQSTGLSIRRLRVRVPSPSLSQASPTTRFSVHPSPKVRPAERSTADRCAGARTTPRLKNPLPRMYRDRGRAYVEIDGRRVRLGPRGSDEAEDEYRRLMAEWVANGRKLPAAAVEASSVTEVSGAYLKEARYRYDERHAGDCGDEPRSLKRSGVSRQRLFDRRSWRMAGYGARLLVAGLKMKFHRH